MTDLVRLWQKPAPKTLYMLAGWNQWADAGSISSGLPEYLIEQTDAEQIGELLPDNFYLFQLPGTHHLLRPEVKLDEGVVQSVSRRRNELYYTGNEQTGLLIFLGEEPHMNEEDYAEAFFYIAEELNVSRIVAVGGVYGALPYDKERNVSCSFSLEPLRSELEEYAVRFSNYEGGSTIGTYLVAEAQQREIELVAFYGFVPAYEFGQLSSSAQGIRIDQDFKAWYDIMRRINHMFDLGISLADLSRRADELILSVESDLDELSREIPQLNIREYLQQVGEGFDERMFMPMHDVWEEELGSLFDEMDD